MSKDLLRWAKGRAKAKGIPVDITEADIRIPSVCPVLGIPLFKGTGKLTDNSPTLDRIDSTGGYTKDNVLVVSARANRIKSDATIEELLKVAIFYFQLTYGENHDHSIQHLSTDEQSSARALLQVSAFEHEELQAQQVLS